MKAVPSRECTASMMNANGDIVCRSGETSAQCLITFLSLPSLMRGSCVCMVVCRLNWISLRKLILLLDHKMFLTKVCYVIYYGLILMIIQDGVQMNVVFPLFSDKIS